MNNITKLCSIVIVGLSLVATACGSDSTTPSTGSGADLAGIEEDDFFTSEEIEEISAARTTFDEFDDLSPFSYVMVVALADIACEDPTADMSVNAGLMEPFLDEQSIRTEFSSELEAEPLPGVTDSQISVVLDHIVVGVDRIQDVGIENVMNTAVADGWCER